MKLSKGLFTDSTLQETPEGYYTFAKNIVSGNVLGVKENEDGFLNPSQALLAPYTIIGVCPIGKDFVVFSTDNTNSEVGKITRNGETTTYTKIYNNPALNFNINDPIINPQYRVDVNNEIVVAWVQKNNEPRVLNINKPPTDIDQLSIFPKLINPQIVYANTSTYVSNTGGSLKTGSLTLITKYRNSRDLTETNWFVHERVFYINDDAISLFNFNFAIKDNEPDGGPGGIVSSKSLTVTFSNFDNQFDTLLIGYIQTINNITTAQQVLSVPITLTTDIKVLITGNEDSTPVSLEEILTPTTVYKTASTITQLAGRLFLGNLTTEPFPELQQAAVNVQVRYVLESLQDIKEYMQNIPPTLMPGEVYALYLGVELTQGGWRAYHIPGRTALLTEKDLVNDFSGSGLNYKRFQVEDTCSTIPNGGILSYWENEGETYPNTPIWTNIGLAGTPVRHHKTPTIGFFAQNPRFTKTTQNTVPRIYLQASNVIIPNNLKDKIKRWKIFYAKKTDTNSLFLGNDIYQVAATPVNEPQTRWSTGGNWWVNAYNQDPRWDRFYFNRDTVDPTKHRGHCLDYLLNPNKTKPDYVEFSFKMKSGSLNTNFNASLREGRLSTSGKVAGKSASAVIRYDGNGVPILESNFTGRKRRIDEFFYLDQNTKVNEWKSLYNEASLATTIFNVNLSVSSLNIYLPGLGTRGSDTEWQDNQQLIIYPDTNTGGGTSEQTYLLTYYKKLTSVHNSFENQTLIPLEGYGDVNTTSTAVFGGNGFISNQSFLTLAPLNANPDGTLGQPDLEGIRMWKVFTGYSTNNYNYRNEIPGDTATFYFPKTDPRNLFSPPIPKTGGLIGTNTLISAKNPVNKVVYNTDYSVLNEYTNPIIYRSTDINQTVFPHTIIYTPVQSEESRGTSWKTFLAGDRYVIPKNKGVITNLQGFNNTQLLIHTESSLFKTRSDIQVATQQNSENVFFKSASLFDLTPEEVIPVTSGYAGTQHSQACILTKAGYFFVDNNQGKAFLYSGQLEEISSYGLRNFFRDQKTDNLVNNAFTAQGYTAGYDERNNRLIVSKKYNNIANESWTLSYSPQDKYWVSYHDYTPDCLFTTVDNVLWSFKQNRLYIHNLQSNNTQKGKFYGDQIFPSYIDVPFNAQPEQDKLYTSVNWLTEMYPNTYTQGQPNQNLSYQNTFTHITLRGLDHCSGRIALIPDIAFGNLYNTNLRNLNRTWYFNDIRDIALQTGFTLGFYQDYLLDLTKLDINMPWYNRRRFIDKMVICRLEYDNLINNRILLLNADIDYTNFSR